MKVSNAVVVGIVCAFASGCSSLPISFPTGSDVDITPTQDLFVNDSSGAIQQGAIGGSSAPPRLKIRKSERGNMESYAVRGQTYYPMTEADGYSARGIASWYGPNFHGRTASNGEVYDMYRLTAAHKTLPLPTYVRVTNSENGRVVVVKINDRGPFAGDRILDLSFAAALRLGMVKDGTANVEIQALSPEEMMAMSGPDNNLGIDFYYVDANGAETDAPVDPQLVDPQLVDPQLTETIAAESTSDAIPQQTVLASASPELQPEATVAAANVPSQPVLVQSAAEGVVVSTSSGQEVANLSARAAVAVPVEPIVTPAAQTDAPIEPIEIAASAVDAIDDSVLPVVADAAGQSVAAVPAAVQVVKVPSNKDRAGYYIQAGVYADVSIAERVAVDVVLAAPAEEVHVKPLKDTEMYRITVGPISSSDHASKVSTMLNDAGVETFTVNVK